MPALRFNSCYDELITKVPDEKMKFIFFTKKIVHVDYKKLYQGNGWLNLT